MDNPERRLAAAFGYSRDPSAQLLPIWLQDRRRAFDFGHAGRFEIACSWGQTAETNDALVCMIGSLRGRDHRPLAADDLLERRLITPRSVDAEALTGNALLLCFSKREPSFAAYQTLMALPQLYYCQNRDGFLAATDLAALLPSLDRVEVDEEVLPYHFLFRLVPGPRTYFRQTARLFPGRLLRWRRGELGLDRRSDLRNEPERHSDSQRFTHLDHEAFDWLYRTMLTVTETYVEEAAQRGRSVANLLSGGVDSSVVQMLLNERLPASERASFSFAVDASSFHFEVEYARDASQRFRTRHDFCEIRPEDYPSILQRAITALQQPTLFNEGVPCQLALSEFLRRRGLRRTSFLAGQAADSLNGVPDLIPILRAERCRRIPGATAILRAIAPLLRRVGKGAESWLDTARMSREPDPLTSPTSYVALAGELHIARHCFGDAAVARAFDERRQLEAEYLASADLGERVQTIDFLTAGYEPGVAAAQLFASQGLELIQLYLDEEIVRALSRFAPSIRYQKTGRLKPLMKGLLERRSQADLASKRKGGTAFNSDLFAWMATGPLRDMVDAIDRPSFLSRRMLGEMVTRPGDFLWNLLIYDLFRKQVC